MARDYEGCQRLGSAVFFNCGGVCFCLFVSGCKRAPMLCQGLLGFLACWIPSAGLGHLALAERLVITRRTTGKGSYSASPILAQQGFRVSCREVYRALRLRARLSRALPQKAFSANPPPPWPTPPKAHRNERSELVTDELNSHPPPTSLQHPD